MHTPFSQRWKRLVALSAIIASSSALVLAVAPEAGTSIGNQATATYTDGGNIQRTATSNIAVTIVQQVSSFTLTADQTRLATPGGQVYFPHTLTNTGNGSDTFTLSVVNTTGDNFDLGTPTLFADADGDGAPDDANPITTTGSLAAGVVFKFVAVGVVPGAGINSNDTGVINVRAIGTATSTPAAQQINVDTVRATNNAVIDVRKQASALSGAPGSSPHTFTLTYTNNGNSVATNLIITDTLPAGMTYRAGTARWSVTGGSTLTDAAGDTQGVAPATITYDYGFTTPRTVTATIARVEVGESRTVTFDVQIDSPLAAGTLRNTAKFRYDPGTGTPVGPFDTNTVDFVVTPNAGVTITGATVGSAPQGATVSFLNPVTNTGNAADSFDITVANGTFPAGTTFILYKPGGNTTLLDTNSNGIPDTGLLPPGSSFDLVVKAILPPGASGTNANYTAPVTATSRNSSSTSATANDILTSIVANTVDLTNNTFGPSAPGAGPGPETSPVITNAVNPGATTRFTLYVSNTSPSADTFLLAASTDSSFATTTLPPGWTVTFKEASGATITDTDLINSGANKIVYADVSVPGGFLAGTRDLTFRAFSPTTGAGDRLHDAVTVNAVRSVQFSPPSNSGQIFPGGSVIYAHTLTNRGNILEGDGVVSSIALTRADSQSSWTSVIYFDANNSGQIDATDPIVSNTTFISNGAAGLAPGESVPLLVKVSAPPGVKVNLLDTTTVSATTTNGSYVLAVPPVAVANEATTVISGDLRLTKEQALDANNDGTPDGPYSTSDITTGAKPGAAIRYRITVTNTGTSPALSVRIFDTTPAFTKYTLTGPAALNGSATGVTAPATADVGSLEFDAGTLAPGDSAVATFGVTIDR